MRRRLCPGLCSARASASACRSGRLCSWSRLRLGGWLLGFARLQLGLGRRTLGAPAARPHGMGCGPLGAPRRSLALPPRPLALRWRTHSCVPSSHSCERQGSCSNGWRLRDTPHPFRAHPGFAIAHQRRQPPHGLIQRLGLRGQLFARSGTFLGAGRGALRHLIHLRDRF